MGLFFGQSQNLKRLSDAELLAQIQAVSKMPKLANSSRDFYGPNVTLSTARADRSGTKRLLEELCALCDEVLERQVKGTRSKIDLSTHEAIRDALMIQSKALPDFFVRTKSGRDTKHNQSDADKKVVDRVNSLLKSVTPSRDIADDPSSSPTTPKRRKS